MTIATGGYNFFGYSIGVLMNESTFPRIPGDAGNATTFPFPVRLKVVKGAWFKRVIDQSDESLLAPFILAAKELEEEGVEAITTNCGFLAMFQQELSKAVAVPVFTSSLLWVPMIARMLGPNKRVGIMTVDSRMLKEKHFNGCGWSSADIPVVVYGMENEKLFTRVFREDLQSFEVEQLEEDMVNVATRMVDQYGDVGAIVFECTNMAPYANAVQAAVGLPIFDIQTLIRTMYDALHQPYYEGHM